MVDAFPLVVVVGVIKAKGCGKPNAIYFTNEAEVLVCGLSTVEVV